MLKNNKLAEIKVNKTVLRLKCDNGSCYFQHAQVLKSISVKDLYLLDTPKGYYLPSLVRVKLVLFGSVQLRWFGHSQQLNSIVNSTMLQCALALVRNPGSFKDTLVQVNCNTSFITLNNCFLGFLQEINCSAWNMLISNFPANRLQLELYTPDRGTASSRKL